MREIPKNKRIYTNDSCALAMAHRIHSQTTAEKFSKTRNNLPHILLPDSRTLFSLLETTHDPLYVFLNSSKESAHIYLMQKLSQFLCSKENGMFQEIEIFQNKVASLCLDRINTQRRSSFMSK